MQLPRAFLPLAWLFNLALLFGTVGCSQYHLGTGDSSRTFHSVYIAPVENLSVLPQAVAPVSGALRTAFLRDGRLTLAATPEAADVVLHLTLQNYDRSFTAVRPADTALARKFDLHLKATCTLQRTADGQAVFTHRPVAATRQIYVDGGQNPAEYQTLPNLAADLADQVLHAVLDVW